MNLIVQPDMSYSTIPPELDSQLPAVQFSRTLNMGGW